MILPENEFSHLKGVNNQPYLDIRTSASHLTNIFILLYFTLLFTQLRFLHSSNRPFPSCIWSLCPNESKYAKPFIWFAPTELIFTRRLVLKQRFKDTFIHELLARAFDYNIRGPAGSFLLALVNAPIQFYCRLRKLIFPKSWKWSLSTLGLTGFVKILTTC